MEENTKERLHEVIKKFFDGGFNGDTWNYRMLCEDIYAGGLGGLDGKFSELKFNVVVNESVVTCYHILPVSVPPEARRNVAEFITRANYSLLLGCFEMDFNDGELRYKMNVSANDLLDHDEDAVLAKIERLILLGASMWKRYGDQLALVLFDLVGDKTIADLISEAEER